MPLPLDPFWKEWGGKLLFWLIFAPLGLVWVAGLFGLDIFSGLEDSWFGLWFMASLTACGAFAFSSSIYESIRGRRKPEFIWLLVTGFLTYWWGLIVYRTWNSI
jgi:hypothetical protein